MIRLTFWNSIIIVVGFSFLVVFMDEYMLKPWREKKWERQAASGDKEKQELLKLARSAKVVEE
ncbi:MAG: hypothetical protein HY899_04315 [Deltaproteobacteria bacterium]|nr:hypothetical protein [Deltaproteobacteria bacterium]